MEPTAYLIVGICAVVATAVLALFLDAVGGIVLGLVAAESTIVVQRAGGVWTTERFAQSRAFTLALVPLGWCSGRLTGRLRVRVGDGAKPNEQMPFDLRRRSCRGVRVRQVEGHLQGASKSRVEPGVGELRRAQSGARRCRRRIVRRDAGAVDVGSWLRALNAVRVRLEPAPIGDVDIRAGRPEDRPRRTRPTSRSAAIAGSSAPPSSSPRSGRKAYGAIPLGQSAALSETGLNDEHLSLVPSPGSRISR